MPLYISLSLYISIYLFIYLYIYMQTIDYSLQKQINAEVRSADKANKNNTNKKLQLEND